MKNDASSCNSALFYAVLAEVEIKTKLKKSAAR